MELSSLQLVTACMLFFYSVYESLLFLPNNWLIFFFIFIDPIPLIDTYIITGGSRVSPLGSSSFCMLGNFSLIILNGVCSTLISIIVGILTLQVVSSSTSISISIFYLSSKSMLSLLLCSSIATLKACSTFCFMVIGFKKLRSGFTWDFVKESKSFCLVKLSPVT